MRGLLDTVRKTASSGTSHNFYNDMTFNHVLWEDVDGRVQAYPPLPDGAVLTDYTGFKGVARNSFVRICNVAAADLEDCALGSGFGFSSERLLEPQQS